jgi:uncharacterized protein with GYD domain
MARFLFEGRYSSDGVKGILKEGGTGRVKAVKDALEKFGGKIEAFYFAFGDTDIYIIVDGIDEQTALAFALGVGASGALANVKTTVLLSPAEVDEAAKKTMSYRAPGH